MRKLLVLACLAAAGALGLTAAQGAVTDNETVPIDIVVFIPCANGGAGDTVELTGPLHILTTSTINDNHVSGKEHFQPQGVSGTSAGGTKYQATGETQDDFSGSLNNGQFQATFVNNFKIIGQGPGNNFLVHENTHLTINADGTVTATVDNFSVDCK